MTGVSPLVLKTAQVVSVFKKDSKLDCNNYCPISLSSKILKILEQLMYERVYTFLNNIDKRSLWSFCELIKSFWHCRIPDTSSKIESIWNKWSSK